MDKTIAGCRVRLTERSANALAVVLGSAEDAWPEMEDVSLCCVEVPDWNGDLSPWAAAPVFGREGFSGGAEPFLQKLLGEILPAVDAGRYAHVGIAGYSLAGLFALWAACRCDVFDCVASVSGSLWFDGFTDWLQTHPVRAERVFLSVGDREKHSRNPRMARVEEATRQAAGILTEQGAQVQFTLNPGGHFQDPDLRLAAGLKAMFP